MSPINSISGFGFCTVQGEECRFVPRIVQEEHSIQSERLICTLQVLYTFQHWSFRLGAQVVNSSSRSSWLKLLFSVLTSNDFIIAIILVLLGAYL